MTWDDYKTLCDRPDVWSRWMLEQTVALLDTAGESHLARRLALTLESEPLEKPPGHKGGTITDMFVLALERDEVDRVAATVAVAVARGLHTTATRSRGHGGFVEAWDEYRRWREQRG